MAPKKRMSIGILWTDTWCQELLAITTSILAYLAILILFAVYNGKPDFQWHGLTLNATVSVLSTTSRLLLLIAVSSCIGQLRWNLFVRRQTPLSFMDTWDNASRGAWGCFALLWETRSLSVGAIGAWLTILAVVFEPSVQQALRFTSDLDLMKSGDTQVAEISAALSWAGGRLEANSAQISIGGDGNLIYRLAASLDFSMQSALYNGLTATQAQTLQQTPFRCSSSSCEWEPYQSLAVCSACYDVHDQITARQVTAADNVYTLNYYWDDFDTQSANFTGTIYSLPNGLSIWNIASFWDQALMTTKSVSRWSESLRFRNNNTLIFAMSMLQLPPSWSEESMLSQLSAVECGIYYCIKSYKSSFLNGTLKEYETEVSSTMDPGSFQVQPNATASDYAPEIADVLYDQSSYVERTDMRVLPPSTNASTFDALSLTVSQSGIAALIDQVTLLFNTSSTTTRFLPLNVSIGGSMRQTEKFGNVFSPASIQTLYQSTDIQQTFANLAKSITNDMRRNGRTTQILEGYVGLPVTRVNVRWGWVTFSATVVISSTLFLLTSILLSRSMHVPLWKTSVLAMIFHELHPRPPIESSHKPTMHEMEHLAQSMSAKLGEDQKLDVEAIPKKEKTWGRKTGKRSKTDSKSKKAQVTNVAQNTTQSQFRTPQKPVSASTVQPA